MGFKIGKGSSVHLGGEFDAARGFEMGANSVINQNCRIDTRGGIAIGDNVSISAEVCVLTSDHDLDSPTFASREGPVLIEDYVFIGTRALILPGVRLGKGCAVAAGAVVTKDVAPYTIVAGVPARPVRERSQDLRYDCRYMRLFR